VTGVAEDKVVLDGNHPLAGVALRYHLKICDIRSASEDELERGSVAPDALSVSTKSLH
jgi:FKBP-type peptidyl-prolyl cis-trans isomerase SlyD